MVTPLTPVSVVPTAVVYKTPGALNEIEFAVILAPSLIFLSALRVKFPVPEELMAALI